MDWRIELLGGLTARKAERTVTRFRTQRGGLLLAMLAIKPGSMVAREELGERLWPEEALERQRERLRGELSDLRATLGEDIFQKQGNAALGVRPAVECDVDRFQTAFLAAVRASNPDLRRPHLEAAAALYKGDLLPGHYDDWTLVEREKLRETYFDVLTRLILDLETLGRGDEARRWRRDTAAHFPEHVLPPAPAAPQKPPSAFQDYFGREEVVARVAAWVEYGSERVLTLTGPGGIGKTRLSREAARGAVFVPLAEVRDASAGFFEALHRALELPRGEAAWRPQVVRALQSLPRPVLVLDNFEQIVDDGAPLVAQLLKECPGLRCIVTSRRRLGIAGEWELPLEPLPHRTGVVLFLDRARRVRSDFAQSLASLQLVEEIVALLEGLPLAIELAAARAVVLGPRQMKEQLSRRLQFLVNRRFPTTERHRSLRAALDWSVDLLSPELKRFFARLSVFRGGWSLEAAAQVCACSTTDALDALDELHEHSLLTVAFDVDEEARYDMLVVVREYAAEVLDEIGEAADARARHTEAVSALAETLRVEGLAGRMAWTLSRLGGELENLRQALAWARDAGSYDRIYDWLDKVGGKLFEGGWWDDFKALMDAVDGHLVDDGKLMRFCSLRGALLRRQGREDEAAAYWERWLELARRLGDRPAELWALMQLADQRLDLRDTAGARRYLEAFHRLAEGDPHQRLVGETLECRLAYLSGVPSDACRRKVEALLADPAFENLGLHQNQILHAIRLLVAMGETETSLVWAIRLLRYTREVGQRFLLARALDQIAETMDLRGDGETAVAAATLASRIHQEIASRFADASRRREEDYARRYAPHWGLVTDAVLWDTINKYI